MNWMTCLAMVVAVEVLALLFLAVPFCRGARRGWDRLDGRHGPQVIGRDALIRADAAIVVAAPRDEVPDA